MHDQRREGRALKVEQHRSVLIASYAGAIGVHVRFLIGIAYRRNLLRYVCASRLCGRQFVLVGGDCEKKTATAKPASTPNTFSISPPCPHQRRDLAEQLWRGVDVARVVETLGKGYSMSWGVRVVGRPQGLEAQARVRLSRRAGHGNARMHPRPWLSARAPRRAATLSTLRPSQGRVIFEPPCEVARAA